MDAVERVFAALDSVEHRLTEPICVGDMAAAAGCSLFHFIRLFNAVTWHSPYDYAMRRKIGASAARVLGGAESLLEIALDLGFESPEGFTRAFCRVFGINPSDARREGFVDPRKILHLPDKFMLDVLSRCKIAGKTRFESEFALNIRTAAARGPAEALESAAGGLGNGNWIGVIYASENDGGIQVFAGPGGPFRLNIEAGSWFEMVHRGPVSDLKMIPGLTDFVFWTALGLSEPPDKIIMHRNNASETQVFIRAEGGS